MNARSLGSTWRRHDRGAFELGGPTSDVLNTTGRQPETITRRHAAGPEAQRTAGNFLRTVPAS